MWRDPSPSDAKESIKTDPTAAARSPIRRHRRPSRDSAIPRVRLANRAATRPPPEAYTSIDEDTNSDVLGRSGPLPAVPDVRISFGSEARDQENRRTESIHRESSHISDLMDFIRRAEDSRRPRLPSYTPNFAPARVGASEARRLEFLREMSSSESDWNPPPGWNVPRSASPNSYSSVSTLPPHPNVTRSPEFVHTDSAADDRDRRAVPVGFPPLRRMGRRNIADGPLPSSSLRESWSPATTVDGLGDRERSFSPETEEWDTMLHTIQPDNTLPSAGSSFASAAASRSFSNSQTSSRSGSINSAESARTHLTVPSVANQAELCDDVATSGSDTEPEEASNVRLASSRRRRRRVHEPRGLGLSRHATRSPYMRPDSRSDNTTFRNTARGSPRANHARPALQEPRQNSAQSLFLSALDDVELDEMREIVARLARREDIPEEVWVSAGLTRMVAQNVERAEAVLRERAERLDRGLERF